MRLLVPLMLIFMGFSNPAEAVKDGPAGEPEGKPGPAAAQDEESEALNLSSDRPTFSEGAIAVRESHIQAEFGAEYMSAVQEDQLLLPLVLVRWGVGDTAELRFSIPSVRVRWPDDEASLTDVTVLGIGLKYYWVVSESVSVAVSPYLSLPLKADQYESVGVALGSRLIGAARFSEWMGMTVNIGAEFSGLGGNQSLQDRSYPLSLALDFNLFGPLTLVTEVFSVVAERSRDDVPVNVDLGLLWLVSDRFQMDIYAGMDVTEAPQGAFFGLGAVYLW